MQTHIIETYHAEPKISVTAKLDGIRSWSLQALETCPGSKGDDGEMVPACSGCYATQGNYLFPHVKAIRAYNREDWQCEDWVSVMVAELDSDRYFRWFDSGDVYALGLAEKILQVMQQTPWAKHWLPTRMHKFPKFAAVLAQMQALPNVMVRASADTVDGTYTAGVHGSCIVPSKEQTPEGAKTCLAPEHEGKCNRCRACWNKAVPVVAYVAVGQKMKKVIRLSLA